MYTSKPNSNENVDDMYHAQSFNDKSKGELFIFNAQRRFAFRYILYHVKQESL